MGRLKLPKLPPISLAKQNIAMRREFPHFESIWSKNSVTWVGTIQPTELSRVYTVRITYSLENPPRVEVINPKLKRNDKNQPIPHTFNDGSLCLYFYKNKEWDRKNDLIAETIIPWISEWLFYYEIWHATGEWKGGGIEHNESIRNKLS